MHPKGLTGISPKPCLLLKCFCYLFIIHSLQSSYGKHHRIPSTCGHIRNINHPFRLGDDPHHCDDSKYQLSCENKTALVCIKSQKYHVQAINYESRTIRLTYPTVEKHGICSFPKHSLHQSSFRSFRYPYRVNKTVISTITFMSCPHPASNSALLVETTKDCFNQSGNYTYIKVGHLNESYVDIGCRIELMVMTSWPFKDENNVSLSEIHSSLLYGFKLSFGSWTFPLWAYVIGIMIYGAVFAIALSLALRIFIGMPTMLGLLIYKLHRRKYSSIFDVIEGFLQGNNNLIPIRYSYSDLKKITRGFREKLGQGGYGSVYKGKLRSGHDVAVKVLSRPKANGQDFINEVATIGRIHHVNVVKLVGYCAERSKRALVYDYMTNSSLDKYIFKRERANSLSLERRYEIAIGVARGIEYLHQGCDIQILHFDIKPHNILLDDSFTPKISDFGLAKFYSTEKNMVTLTAPRGTIGYVAPELINRSIGMISNKADVYSFGMLLMEMVGLKDMVAAEGDESSKYFPYWIYDRFNKGKDIEIGDVDEDNDDGGEYTRKITRKMTLIGLWCIQMSPSDRPSMSEVLKMFECEGENLQIPPQPSQSPQTPHNNVETWGMESTDSIALLGDDASTDE